MMSDIEKKVLALVNKVRGDDFKSIGEHGWGTIHLALCRAIEQHEAFRRDVSKFAESVGDYLSNSPGWVAESARFIIPKPVDPLVEALNEALGRAQDYEAHDVEDLRSSMKARGYEITKIGEGA